MFFIIMINKFLSIESRLLVDEGNRGIKKIVPESPQLYAACLELVKCKTVGILTGFPCLFNSPVKIESDGLAGALSISRFLCSQKIQPTILIDELYIPVMQDLINWHNKEFLCDVGLSSSLDHSFEGIVSIERAGRSRDGNYYTMRALLMENILELDTVYLDQKPCRTRVAIGDGGNEAGLGGVQDKVRAHIKNGEIIASCSMSDFIIISSVSTWGGYALSLALSLVCESQYLISLDEEEKIAQKLMELNICDGILGVPQLGIDGLDWNYTKSFIEDINFIKQS